MIQVDIFSTLDKKNQATLKFEITLELIIQLFTLNISLYDINSEDIEKLSRNIERFFLAIATTMEKKVDLIAAQAFYL